MPRPRPTSSFPAATRVSRTIHVHRADAVMLAGDELALDNGEVPSHALEDPDRATFARLVAANSHDASLDDTVLRLGTDTTALVEVPV